MPSADPRCVPSRCTTARTGPVCSTVTFVMLLVYSSSRIVWLDSYCERSSRIIISRPSRATSRPSTVIDSIKTLPAPPNPATQRPGRNLNRLRRILHTHRRRRSSRSRRSNRQRPSHLRIRRNRQPGPLHRPIRPESQRPALRSHHPAARLHRHRPIPRHHPPPPRNPPTHPRSHQRRLIPKPTDRNRRPPPEAAQQAPSSPPSSEPAHQPLCHLPRRPPPPHPPGQHP